MKATSDQQKPFETSQDQSRPVVSNQKWSRPIKTDQDQSRHIETIQDQSRLIEAWRFAGEGLTCVAWIARCSPAAARWKSRSHLAWRTRYCARVYWRGGKSPSPSGWRRTRSCSRPKGWLGVGAAPTVWGGGMRRAAPIASLPASPERPPYSGDQHERQPTTLNLTLTPIPILTVDLS